MPKGKASSEADKLAKKMLHAIGNEAYKETRFLEWSFANEAHKYKWDKVKGIVKVQWDDYTVNLKLFNKGKSLAFKKDDELTAKQASDVVLQAWHYFNNDSFWLVAPFKIFDEGTKRTLVQLKDGSEGLMVTYNTGGSTPGDSYLWKLNANGFPESYQMWVQIIPIGGLKATWNDWQVMESGVFLPASHKLGPITFYMGKVRAYN